jgi:EmrB/QacA subfamily drug resistance transporter
MRGRAGPAPRPLDRRVFMIAAAVSLGAIMTVLDATIVSVAIGTLSREFGSPLPAIQWVLTAYLVAMAAVIPLTGWATDRFGGKRVWMFALVLFVGASALCGLAWSAWSLIVFRAVQGLGAGMIAPVGMTLVAQAAGPRRMGRAMGVVGVPLMLGPVLGPMLGGVLLSTGSWQWIFFGILPIGVITVLWSRRVIEPTPARRGERLDLTGLLLLSPSLALLVYGASELASSAGFHSRGMVIGLFGGSALLVLFVVHARGVERPLLELRHFANRAFVAAGAVQALTGVVLYGAMLLLPLYYQVVRGASALTAGLLLMPQGIGAALIMLGTGRMVDRGAGRLLVLTGLPVLAAGFIAFTRSSSYLVTSASLFVVGLGTGALVGPLTRAVYLAGDRADLPGATATLSILQRMGGALGTALCAVVLRHNLDHLAGPAAPAAAFSATFWLPLVVAAVAVLPALLLPRPRRLVVPAQRLPDPRERVVKSSTPRAEAA